VLEALDRASIPVVLLDRTVGPYPAPGSHDLVAIDHRYAGYLMTRHLIERGCRCVAFLARREAATSVDAREAGYRDAIRESGTATVPTVCRVDGLPDDMLADLTRTGAVDGLVCANDRIAGDAAQSLARLGRRVPDDVRVVGMDDVGYAEALPVPLTTYRQPVAALGDAAVGVMLDRVTRPDRPPRETLLQGTVIERASSGTAPGA
jgi:DNA-binding LacI/PurR family transcriptional regulator